MKLLFIVLALTFLVCTEARKFDHLRKYLAEHDESLKSTSIRDDPSWLKNSNTIALGYHPLYGSPLCYTGQCQSEGFRRSIFNLSYVQPVLGSCTSKRIPEFVDLHCIPSANLHTSTETISTLNQLSESTSEGISFGADLKYKMFSAGYSYSKETRYMIDQIIKQDTTAMFTHVQVTYAKLSMIEPLMKLSNAFHQIIEEMPCCDDNSQETDDYIQEFFIDYFGLTFVTQLILGGISQDTMFIDNKEMRRMQSNGEDVSHSASIGFFLKFDINSTSSYNKTQHNKFMQSVKTRRSTRLGGDPSAQTMADWTKSVPENPAIVKYTVKDISTLLTRKRFPNDIHIQNKSKLVEMAIQRYLDRQKPICVNNCTDSNHGECNVSSTAPFLLGTCKCRFGWMGNDCSEKARWVQNGETVAGGKGFGRADDQLWHPDAVDVDDDEKIVIADWYNDRIMEWKKGATMGRVVAGGNRVGSQMNQVFRPTDVVIDEETDSLIICDNSQHRVVRWSRQQGTSYGEILIDNIACWGLAMDNQRYLYVTDHMKHEVRRYEIGNNTGTIVAGGKGVGNRLNQFNFTTCISVDGEQSVYVSDTWNHRVMKWVKGATEGIVVAGGRGVGSNLTQLSYPRGLFVDDMGTVYVVEGGNTRVTRWQKGMQQGTVIVGGNGEGAGANQLRNPFGLSFDRHGNLYVADFSNHRVQQFATKKD